MSYGNDQVAAIQRQRPQNAFGDCRKCNVRFQTRDELKNHFYSRAHQMTVAASERRNASDAALTHSPRQDNNRSSIYSTAPGGTCTKCNVNYFSEVEMVNHFESPQHNASDAALTHTPRQDYNQSSTNTRDEFNRHLYSPAHQMTVAASERTDASDAALKHNPRQDYYRSSTNSIAPGGTCTKCNVNYVSEAEMLKHFSSPQHNASYAALTHTPRQDYNQSSTNNAFDGNWQNTHRSTARPAADGSIAPGGTCTKCNVNYVSESEMLNHFSSPQHNASYAALTHNPRQDYNQSFTNSIAPGGTCTKCNVNYVTEAEMLHHFSSPQHNASYAALTHTPRQDYNQSSTNVTTGIQASIFCRICNRTVDSTDHFKSQEHMETEAAKLHRTTETRPVNKDKLPI